MTVDILPIPQVADLTFDSRATGAFAAGAGGVVVCEGRFEFVDTTMPDYDAALPRRRRGDGGRR